MMSDTEESTQKKGIQAQRSEATRRALLDAAMADMEATGEASIRITKVLQESGITNGSLYHHFGSREGLVQAAVIERFIGSVSVGLGAFASSVSAITSPEGLAELFRAELVRIGSPEVRAQRVRRMTAFAAALPRAELLERIVTEQSKYFDRAAGALQMLQDRGVIAAGVDVRAFAAWALGLMLSRLLSDIDPELDPDKEWTEYTYRSLLAILLPSLLS
jgi:AcrR family transcriptional regulator